MSQRRRLVWVSALATLVAALLGFAWLRHQARHACDGLPAWDELARLEADPSRAEDVADAYALRARCRPWSSADAMDLAAAQLKLGRRTEALAALELAVKRGYDDPDALGTDEALAQLRGDPRFNAAVDGARVHDEQGFGPIDPAHPLEGLRTQEGRPDGGLRYRLRVPADASPGRPSRVILWMQGSGGLFNEVETQLAQGLGRLGFAFVVPTQRDTESWRYRDAEKFLGPTLSEIQARDDISDEPPIILGFSAGGQVSLDLWRGRPERFLALVLVAAYPVERRRDAEGYELTALPTNPSRSEVPIFVLVGEEDGLVDAWRRVTGPWLDAGVPLTVHYVPGEGHDWLMSDAEYGALTRWLGTLPGPRDAGR